MEPDIMRQTLVEDRVIARLAAEAVGWNVAAQPAELADIAFGQAVVALRVLGIAVTPEVSQTVQDDIALLLADPEALARARILAMAPGAAPRRPANSNGSVAPRASVG